MSRVGFPVLYRARTSGGLLYCLNANQGNDSCGGRVHGNLDGGCDGVSAGSQLLVYVGDAGRDAGGQPQGGEDPLPVVSRDAGRAPEGVQPYVVLEIAE